MSNKPRLAYVVNSLVPGGTEKLVVQMSKAFAGDYDVVVFCLDEPGEWSGELRSAGIPVHVLWRQPGLDLMVAWRLARHFDRLRVDIVHAHQTTPWFYSALSRLFFRRPRLLFEEHGRFWPEPDSVKRRIVNRHLTARLTHRLVAVSDDVRERVARYEGVPIKRIQLIYNGVEPPMPLAPEARAALRHSLGIGEDQFVVGTVGRLDKIKNLPMFVESIGRAREAAGSICGLIVGDGPERAAVQQLIDSLGLHDEIRMTGYRSDAREITQCFDLFVLASVSEGTSMALLDALAAGVPAAVTGVGGNPEVVAAGESGWVVSSDDRTALAQAILAAAQDPGLARRFAEAGRCRFSERFTFAGMLARYDGVYRDMLGAS